MINIYATGEGSMSDKEVVALQMSDVIFGSTARERSQRNKVLSQKREIKTFHFLMYS